jgi:hypothetical protein
MTPPHEASRLRCSGDGGSIVVESAMILPFVVMLLAGIVDFGVGFRDRITIQGALRNSVRQLAFLADDRSVDKSTLASLNAGLGNLHNVVIQFAVVYKFDPATNPSGQVPAACLTTSKANSGSGVNGVCNVYTGPGTGGAFNQILFNGSWVMAGNVTPGNACTTGWDQYWCTTTRNRDITDPPDWAAIWIRVTYTPFTKMFRTSITMEDEAIIRLEPLAG